MLVFRPSFVKCCPSNLLSGSPLPLSTLPCVNKYTVYTYAVCKGWGGGGYGVLGLRQKNTLYRSIVLDDNILPCLLKSMTLSDLACTLPRPGGATMQIFPTPFPVFSLLISSDVG